MVPSMVSAEQGRSRQTEQRAIRAVGECRRWVRLFTMRLVKCEKWGVGGDRLKQPSATVWDGFLSCRVSGLSLEGRGKEKINK